VQFLETDKRPAKSQFYKTMTETQQKSLTIKIGKLWNSGEGTNEKFQIDVPVEFDKKEIEAASNLTADVMLIKLKNEIAVILENAEITLKTTCQRCLKPLEVKVEIESAERQYLDKEPDKKDDPFDLFLINFTNMTIDLGDMVRQEIILHFPLKSLCSKSCKGLCSVCGKNRNKMKCDCKEEDAATQKPFKDLKKLIKSNYG